MGAQAAIWGKEEKDFYYAQKKLFIKSSFAQGDQCQK